jgi:3-phenylpropionate/trans-cinnamate dioxygenase ferredoxin reductase subunit
VSESIAIVGGGQAGASLVQALRARGFAGAIHLVCAEHDLPYERPPLSKGMLCGEETPTWVLPETFYAEHQVEVHLGHRVTSAVPDAGGRVLHTSEGALLSADIVVIATGSEPRKLPVPGADLSRVHTLGSLGDVRQLRQSLAGAKHVVIAGGGFIGAEVAGGLREKGYEVTVLDPVRLPLAAKTAPWVAERLHQRHEKAGVRFLQDTVDMLEGGVNVERVRTGTGAVLPCDVFLVAVGSRPCVDLPAAMGLNCRDGVLCGDRGRTAIPGVYAMGDVASWSHPVLGRGRIEHFRTAIDHADVVAADIVGAPTPPQRVPWFWTDQYEHRVEVAGRPGMGDTVVLRPASTGETALSLHLADGRVVGAVGLDAPREVRAASRFIENQDVIDPTAVSDSTIDLRKAVLK